MAQFKPVPAYVLEGTTPADMVAAESEYARLQQNPAYDLVKGPRRAAVHAKFASGMALSCAEAVEFASIVPEGYRVAGASSASAATALAAEAARNEWAKAEAQRVRIANAQPHIRFANIREAQDSLSMLDYQKFVMTPEGVKLVAQAYG